MDEKIKIHELNILILSENKKMNKLRALARACSDTSTTRTNSPSSRDAKLVAVVELHGS